MECKKKITRTWEVVIAHIYITNKLRIWTFIRNEVPHSTRNVSFNQILNLTCFSVAKDEVKFTSGVCSIEKDKKYKPQLVNDDGKRLRVSYLPSLFLKHTSSVSCFTDLENLQFDKCYSMRWQLPLFVIHFLFCTTTKNKAFSILQDEFIVFIFLFFSFLVKISKSLNFIRCSTL